MYILLALVLSGLFGYLSALVFPLPIALLFSFVVGVVLGGLGTLKQMDVWSN